jgi:adenosylmethionine-8-amino-7-oxononanoate aminotransferase
MPLAATLTTDEIYQAFLGKYEDFKTFFHGHSYTGNPLGCAVALANLDVFKKEKTLARLQPKIKTMARLLQPLRRMPHVGDIRQRGFIAAIELVKDKKTRKSYLLKARIGIACAVPGNVDYFFARSNIIILIRHSRHAMYYPNGGHFERFNEIATTDFIRRHSINFECSSRETR